MTSFKIAKKNQTSMAPRVRTTTRYSTHSSSLQRSPSVTSGVRGAHLAPSKNSGFAPEVIEIEVHSTVKRRGPDIPPFPITGPNSTSGIAPKVLAADVAHLTRGRVPTRPSVPTNPRTSKKTSRHLASTFQCRTDTPFIDVNHRTEYRAAFGPKENRTFLLPPFTCCDPQAHPHQGVKNEEVLEPIVVQQRNTFGNAQEARSAKPQAPAWPSVHGKRRAFQPVWRETTHCILPQGSCVDESCGTEWVTNYMENFCFLQKTCSKPSPKTPPRRPPSNFRRPRPANHRTEYQAAFGPKILTAQFDFRLFLQLHGTA